MYTCMTCSAALDHQGSHPDPKTGAQCGGRPDYTGPIAAGHGLKAPAWSDEEPPRFYYTVAAKASATAMLYISVDGGLTLDRKGAKPFWSYDDAREAAADWQRNDHPDQTEWRVFSRKAHPDHDFGTTSDGELRCIDCDCRAGGNAAQQPCSAYEAPAKPAAPRPATPPTVAPVTARADPRDRPIVDEGFY